MGVVGQVVLLYLYGRSHGNPSQHVGLAVVEHQAVFEPVDVVVGYRYTRISGHSAKGRFEVGLYHDPAAARRIGAATAHVAAREDVFQDVHLVHLPPEQDAPGRFFVRSPGEIDAVAPDGNVVFPVGRRLGGLAKVDHREAIGEVVVDALVEGIFFYAQRLKGGIRRGENPYRAGPNRVGKSIVLDLYVVHQAVGLPAVAVAVDVEAAGTRLEGVVLDFYVLYPTDHVAHVDRRGAREGIFRVHRAEGVAADGQTIDGHRRPEADEEVLELAVLDVEVAQASCSRRAGDPGGTGGRPHVGRGEDAVAHRQARERVQESDTAPLAARKAARRRADFGEMDVFDRQSGAGPVGPDAAVHRPRVAEREVLEGDAVGLEGEHGLDGVRRGPDRGRSRPRPLNRQVGFGDSVDFRVGACCQVYHIARAGHAEGMADGRTGAARQAAVVRGVRSSGRHIPHGLCRCPQRGQERYQKEQASAKVYISFHNKIR